MTTLPPDKQPIDSLIKAYVNCAVDHRRASREGDPERANRAYEELQRVMRAVRARGDEGDQELLKLLADARVEVRGWAAAHALGIDPTAAESVLEEIAQGPSSLEELSARTVLREWRSGRLRLL